jgi:NAD(P)-dependent dehydrogenase (short-subunit alcohol dehydrogenase family)
VPDQEPPRGVPHQESAQAAQPLSFAERVVAVTGAGRGLGRSHAALLAKLGAKVVVNDLGSTLSGGGADSYPADSVVDEIAAAGGEAIANTASVAEEAGAASIVQAALDRWGRLDAVINNAGILTLDEFGEMPLATLEAHLAVHVAGSFNVTRAAWPHMVRAGYGRVVMTTSSALFGSASLVGYATAKGALVGLGRSLAEAGAGAGIRVNLVAPAAETRMVTDPELRRRSGLPALPSGAAPDEAASAAEVSPTVALLAHELCPVNGEIISAGHGRLARIYVAETRGIVRTGMAAQDVTAAWPEIMNSVHSTIPGSTADYVSQREASIRRGQTPG